ncbi:MAG: formyltetrahydrofolate deformylase [Nitrospirae bacterium]|nr:formyltetrahydrofolate deformylase [Nitrospirota bacterium]
MAIVRFLVSCPDRPGIVAAIAEAIFGLGGNIIQSDQHTTDPSGGAFFMRVEFDLPESVDRAALAAAVDRLGRAFTMQVTVRFADDIKRAAIFVSRLDHCLVDLLWRWKAGDLPLTIPLIVSNHADLKPVADAFGVPFAVFPMTKESKREREDDILQRLDGKVDVIILARYMQILTGAFVARYPARIINIHHSFLPAFVGARPYEQAALRGVKIIGATAHYVTDDLDEGPIIEQDVVRISHRDGVPDLIRKGKDIEKAVLARAVRWHLEDRLLVYRNRTVVFAC